MSFRPWEEPVQRPLGRNVPGVQKSNEVASVADRMSELASYGEVIGLMAEDFGFFLERDGTRGRFLSRGNVV